VTPVLPQDIPKHWEWVERGLNQIIRKTQEKWSAAHVSQALFEGRAFLFVSDRGFVVLQQLREDWTCAPYVNVWAAWFEPGEAKKRRQELSEWLDTVTEQHGCVTWKFGSPRKGWKGYEGWEIDKVIWRRKK
jgi:hypothetical protein